MPKLIIDPVNRMEGHLAIDSDLTPGESGGFRVEKAKLRGQLYRGFENILKGRDPRDSYVITQRI